MPYQVFKLSGRGRRKEKGRDESIKQVNQKGAAVAATGGGKVQWQRIFLPGVPSITDQ